MKHVWKLGTIITTLVVLWLALLTSSGLPSTLSAIVPYLPIYAVVALGCYGLAMVGYGLMVFPTCPTEAIQLQQDIAEAKVFLASHGIDVNHSSD
ncbi:hypothetical protein O6H91_02G114900 [Diphasiastrum complanatum]|uniref:Uncharacterized protein n=1 Tax=Diphasiastrum complanatum TaxID=34168 RepID=A0ACC2EJT1_DIPCM|nr:hypothetical protein O6H91_02G114900 [Diphasiastrum complanatum]